MTELSPTAFLADHLLPRRPVLVRAGLADWAWPPEWDLSTLTARFGEFRVPLYDTLFALHGLSTFGDYVARYTGPSNAGVPPYLRWYARQNDSRLPWADSAFASLADDWSMPAWLPDTGYLFPRLVGRADVTVDAFPAKGIFVCGAGGRTRLHVDPWASDACLCQTTGRKRLVMFSPDAAPLLTAGDAMVDLSSPDDVTFPRWRTAVPAFDEVLSPGDAVYIPAGWFHAATALTDSVSITWNFVHEVHAVPFSRYLRAGGAEDPAVVFFTRR